MVKDQLTGNDYKKEEDPRLFVSKKSGRGPLAEDWIANPPDGVIMCSYKLIKARTLVPPQWGETLATFPPQWGETLATFPRQIKL